MLEEACIPVVYTDVPAIPSGGERDLEIPLHAMECVDKRARWR
jgi:hypothetical protein